MSQDTHGDAIRDAAHAHTTLNTFATIVTILEGGSVYGKGRSAVAVRRIIKICNTEQARQLDIYDEARHKAEHAR